MLFSAALSTAVNDAAGAAPEAAAAALLHDPALEDFRLRWWRDIWLVHLDATREWLTDTTEVHLEQIMDDVAERNRFLGWSPWK